MASSHETTPALTTMGFWPGRFPHEPQATSPDQYHEELQAWTTAIGILHRESKLAQALCTALAEWQSTKPGGDSHPAGPPQQALTKAMHEYLYMHTMTKQAWEEVEEIFDYLDHAAETRSHSPRYYQQRPEPPAAPDEINSDASRPAPGAE